MGIKGTELLAESLYRAGVRFVVGKKDGALGPCLSSLSAREGVTAVTPRGDISGAFMAYGNTYYRHHPAVIMASTPADMVNSLAGMGTAWGDKIPVLAITPRRDRIPGFRLPGNAQEVFLRPFSKWSGRIRRAAEIPGAVGQAFREAGRGCHGPVHLDVDEDALGEVLDIPEERLGEYVAEGLGDLEFRVIEGDERLIEKALELLQSAERPLVVAGGGVVHAQAWEEMDALVRALEIPATTSMAGEGSVYGDNPYYIGGPSYVGGESFHRAVRRADVVMAVGASLGGLEGFGRPPFWNPDIRFIQVDVDPVRIALNVPAEVSILGDAKAVLGKMLEMVGAGIYKPNPLHKVWLEHLLWVKKRWRERVEKEAHGGWPVIHQGFLAKTVKENCPEDTFFVIDGGNTALWAGMFCMDHKPKSALFPAGMGTLGSGIPLAIGIKAADPERPLVVMQGDGSFLYNVQELVTAREMGLSFVVVIFNDGTWNMIKGAQDLFFGARRFGSMLGDIDYASIARGLGCHGSRVVKAEEIGPAFREAMEVGGPAVLDVVTDPDNFPENLISFAVVEFEGVPINPLRAVGIPKMRIDRRLLSRAKYGLNVLLDLDLR
jgi:acetolactate synthase-1/2/3 large subunit